MIIRTLRLSILITLKQKVYTALITFQISILNTILMLISLPCVQLLCFPIHSPVVALHLSDQDASPSRHVILAISPFLSNQAPSGTSGSPHPKTAKDCK